MESLTTLFFYIIAFVMLVSAFAVIFSKNIVHSALFGCLTFLSVAGVYFMLNATFNAVVQIAVYVVAVTILITFAIMLTSRDPKKGCPISFAPRMFFTVISLGGLFLCLLWALFNNYLERIFNIDSTLTLNKSLDTVSVIGEKLMTDYILAFEVVSILLLVLIVGIGLVCIMRKSEGKH